MGTFDNEYLYTSYRQVMGMVLVNPLSGDLFEQDYGSWAQYW